MPTSSDLDFAQARLDAHRPAVREAVRAHFARSEAPPVVLIIDAELTTEGRPIVVATTAAQSVDVFARTTLRARTGLAPAYLAADLIGRPIAPGYGRLVVGVADGEAGLWSSDDRPDVRGFLA
jgi:hypothetical protein